MDEATARLIFQLQLEDLQEVTTTSKGKQRAGEVSDFEVALSCYKSELESGTTFVSDRCMCMSIARAVHQDGNVVNELRAKEEQAAEDRRLALRSQDGNIPPPCDIDGKPQGKRIGDDDLDDELLTKMEALYILGPTDDDDPNAEGTQPESSTWAASRPSTWKHAKATTKRQCACCQEYFQFYDVTRAPCSHEYCRGCLTDLFTRSLTDESLFPPRCCKQPIPAESNRIFLSLKLVGEYQAKKLEMDTPNRTYCHRPNCSAFIAPQFIKHDVGTCVRCCGKTCVICKGTSHKGDCPEDPAIQELLQAAAENGWQQCYSCHRVVELRVGCYHMSKLPP